MRCHSPIAFCVLTAAAVAQSVVLPSLAQARPPSPAPSDANTTSTLAARTQLVYDVADIAPVVAIWSSMQLRPAAGNFNYPPGNGNVTITMAVSTSDFATLSTNFTSNLGSNFTTVYTGNVAISGGPLNPSWPAPWEPMIPFSTPFVYLAPTGKSLVIDVQKHQSNQFWTGEQYPADRGAVTALSLPQLGCRFRNGNLAVAGSYPPPVIGASFAPAYTLLLANAQGFSVFGANASQWAGASLPVDLAPYGAPGCKWAVSADLVVPITASAAGVATLPPLAVPSQPSLVGQLVHDQGLFLDSLANVLGIVATPARTWRIGRGSTGGIIYTTPTGASRDFEWTATVRLN